MKCKQCSGTGRITLYQTERVCQNCNGAGRLTEEAMVETIASIIDVKTLYQSRPSGSAIRKAKDIVSELKKRFDLSEIEKEDA